MKEYVDMDTERMDFFVCYYYLDMMLFMEHVIHLYKVPVGRVVVSVICELFVSPAISKI